MDEHPVFGNDSDFDATAGQQIMELAVAVAVQERFHLGRRFVPALLERGVADVFRYGNIRRIEFAVADNLDFPDAGDFLADEFEDGTAEVARDSAIRLGTREFLGQEGVIKPLAAGGEAVHGERMKGEG